MQARLGGLPIDPHALAAVSNVFRVANAVRLHMERQVLGRDGISWTAFVVLWVLWVWGEQESRHLAAECGVSKATLTGVVGTLEGRGLVTRRRSRHDGRLVIVALTPTGRRMIRRLFPGSTSTKRWWCPASTRGSRTSSPTCCGRSCAVGPWTPTNAADRPDTRRASNRPGVPRAATVLAVHARRRDTHDPRHQELRQRRSRPTPPTAAPRMW